MERSKIPGFMCYFHNCRGIGTKCRIFGTIEDGGIIIVESEIG